jgi:hypothetical protein
MVGWQQAEIIDVYGDGVTNSWQDVDDALQPRRYAIDLLQKTVSRPELEFGHNYEYDNVSGDQMIKMKAAALLLSPTVVSDLHRGDAESAVANLHTLLRLVDAWRGSLVLLQLSRFSMASMASAVQWEILQATNITDSQLASLQRDWETMDIIQSFEKSLVMERDSRFVEIEHLRTSDSPTITAANWFSPSASAGSGGLFDLVQDLRRRTSDTVWRSVWSYDDELRALKADQAMVDAMRRINRDGFFKDAQADLDAKLNAIGVTSTNYSWFRRNLDTNIWSALQESTDLNYRQINRVLIAEVVRKINITAIALKRYQLSHGAFPPDLQALAPEFLSEIPRDPVDGKPLRYYPNADGTFVLYSIGADGKDGGGDVSPGARYKSLYWLNALDWVWPQPATPAEVQYYYDHPPK